MTGRPHGRVAWWLPPVALVACAALVLAVTRAPPTGEGDVGEGPAPRERADGGGEEGALAGVASALRVDVAQVADAVSRRSSPEDLPGEAAAVLAAYRDTGDCVLVRAGYLDLLGDAWGCVVQGDGWAEVSVVRAGADGAGSEVTVVRMDARIWEESLVEEVGDVGEG